MNAPTQIEPAEQPFLDCFKALPERAQLRLFKSLAEQLHSGSYGYDKIIAGIDELASDLAEWDGWRGDDLASRYLDERFIPLSYQRVPMVNLSGVERFGSVVGG